MVRFIRAGKRLPKNLPKTLTAVIRNALNRRLVPGRACSLALCEETSVIDPPERVVRVESLDSERIESERTQKRVNERVRMRD